MTFSMLMGFYVFILASVAGYQLIVKVPPTLHTPLMSGANAISGVTILGAMTMASQAGNDPIGIVLSVLAVVFATVNVVGGFLVTDRMLQMFKAKKRS
jgi:NAD(P) transhydrogenase subunit alpha